MNRTSEVIELLRRIAETLERIEQKIDSRDMIPLNSLSLLELPDNLRLTAMALIKLGEATASEVAEITGRGRAIESHYLNTLVRMKYARKKRRGRKVIYEVET